MYFSNASTDLSNGWPFDRCVKAESGPMSPYESHTGLAQSQGAVGVASGPSKPRVRARRGQATDPHSIAERLRRERIADRMKALQELVPNSNKTDKASMLDEIIEYVKFLQLQVKVLSMSRLGGAAAVAPLVADLPAEGKSSLAAAVLGQNVGFPQDVMATAEQEVASLMEEDMGSAMQFLQSKGLCLMPISLATAISSTSVRPSSGGQAEQGLPSSEQLQMGPYSSFLTRGTGNPSANFMMPSATGGI
ncbi:hypothetical protein L7F22_022105 [Adiantum nelumboides]|nr:hypothetical protein [Adiantum nelumboides]